MGFEQALSEWLHSELVWPVYIALLLATVNFVLGVIAAIRAGTFEWRKFPQFLDTGVLQKVIPLAALSVTAWAAGSEVGAVLTAALAAGSIAVVTSEIANLGRLVGVVINPPK